MGRRISGFFIAFLLMVLVIFQDVILDITSRPCIIVFVINKLTTERGNNYEKHFIYRRISSSRIF